MPFIEANLIHLLAALWFVLCWGGYTRYATWKARDTACLASVLHLYREDWMRRMLLRDNRIADASVIGNLERNASFFASSTLIILAGILTVLGASERAVSLLADIPLARSRCWRICPSPSRSVAASRKSSCWGWRWCSSTLSSPSAGACASTTLPRCWWGRRR